MIRNKHDQLIIFEKHVCMMIKAQKLYSLQDDFNTLLKHDDISSDVQWRIYNWLDDK